MALEVRVPQEELRLSPISYQVRSLSVLVAATPAARGEGYAAPPIMDLKVQAACAQALSTPFHWHHALPPILVTGDMGFQDQALERVTVGARVRVAGGWWK